MTLTRRMRAGYTFALASIRAEVTGEILHDAALDAPVQFFSRTIAICDDALLDLSDRTTRARVALWLRMTLRADADDFGPACCEHCGEECVNGWGGLCVPCYKSPDVEQMRFCYRWRRIDALWERAPLTGTAIRPAKLRRRGGA